MKDRVPANPGRVLITPEDGSASFYATMARADNPTQEGDPLNKNTLLKDATAAMFGLGADAVPDDVLKILGNAALAGTEDGALETALGKKVGVRIIAGSYVGTGTYGAGNPTMLNFGFRPKLLMIYNATSVDSYGSIYGVFNFKIWFSGASGLMYIHSGASSAEKTPITIGETGVSWYSTVSADVQANESANTYRYIAIC